MASGTEQHIPLGFDQEKNLGEIPGAEGWSRENESPDRISVQFHGQEPI